MGFLQRELEQIEQLLQTLSKEDAEEFVQNGLDELRCVLEELNSSN